MDIATPSNEEGFTAAVAARDSGRVPTPFDGAAVTISAPTRLDELYRREYQSLVRLAAAITSRADLAEELVQDTFLAAHRKWERVRDLDRPELWLRRVLVNRSRSRVRRAKTELKLLLRLRSERAPHISLDADDHELWSAVCALPARQSQCIALFYVDDASVADIARILDCGEESVRTHLRRGRAALAQTLAHLTETIDV